MTPEQRALFDKMADLMQHTSLPDWDISVQGNSNHLAVILWDMDTGKEVWKDGGHPDAITERFNAWLKRTYNIVPSIP